MSSTCYDWVTMSIVERNWAGNVTCSPAAVARPQRVAELQEVVAAAAARGNRIRAVGARHSFSSIGSTEGSLVVMDDLRAVVDVDRDRSTVTVEAGIRYTDLAPLLHAEGLALHNLASLPHLSVAGAIATATHGSGDGNQNLAGAVVSIDVVDATGQIVRIERGTDDGSAAIVGLGGFGVVATVTLRVEPTFDVAQEVLVGLPVAAGLRHLDEILGSADSVSLFTDWRDDSFHQVWRKYRVDGGADGLAERFGASVADVSMHPVRGMDAAACTPQLGRAAPWHERLPHFRPDAVPSVGAELQSEYFVDRANGAGAVEAVRALRDRLAGLVLVSELRSVAADEFWLSPAYGRDSLAIHFTWRPDPVAVTAAVTAIESALAPFDARPHWAKIARVPPGELRARFPRLDEWAARRRRFDPGGAFLNEFLDRVMYP
ncbi:MAG: FAD-binding protein [Ilumatobacteraceae bacterium]